MKSSRQLPLFAGAIALSSLWGCSGTGGVESSSHATGGHPSSIAGSPGTGGSSNAGGMTAPGGTSAIAGSVATGGAPASGGATNVAGSISTGGAIATGGANPSGGSTSASTGGTLAAGGAIATGGSKSTGGASSTGGTMATGGATSAGGTKATGGASSVGGTKATGGNSATGGTKSSGGTVATGGSKSTGGSSSAGGTTSAGGGGQTVNCGGTGGSDSCPEGVPAMCGMLAALNAVRASAPGASPPIPPLVWDCSLVPTAQAWADSCPSGHNTTVLNANNLGENIYGSSGSTPAQPASVVSLWASEGPPNYVYATNYCYGASYTTDNFQCGHYTQIVWRNTTRVGCGYKTGCSASSAFAPQIWVCDFAPAGNIYDPRTSVFNLPY